MKRNQLISRKAITMATLTSSMVFLNSCQLFQSEPAPQLFSPRQIVPAPQSAPQTTYEQTTPAYQAPEQEIAPVEIQITETEPVATEPAVERKVTEAPKPERVVYTVRKGDSLWKIGRRYGVSHQELAAENGLNAKKHLRVGMKLTIPSGGKFRSDAEIKSSAPKRAYKPKFVTGPVLDSKKKSTNKKSSSVKKSSIPSNGEYTVKSGDNLWLIARRHDLRVKQIREWNNLATDHLKVGQKLNLKGATATTTTAAAVVTKPAEPVEQDPVTIEEPTANTEPDIIVENTTVEPTGEDTVAGTEGTGDETTPTEEPAATDDPIAGAELVPVEVYEGDTLESIAQDFSSTVELIKAANPTVKSNADLKEGMMLKIPLKE